MNARHVCPKLNLRINDEYFSADLTVLELKGIDVILGQNWIRKHKGITDCARKVNKANNKGGERTRACVKSVSNQ